MEGDGAGDSSESPQSQPQVCSWRLRQSFRFGRELRKEMHELFASSRTAGPRFSSNNRGSGTTGAVYLNRNGKPPSRFHGSQPFPSGSGRASSSNSHCLICAEKGYNIFLHIDSPTQVKFLDGKTAWAKCSAGLGLISPENRALCIN